MKITWGLRAFWHTVWVLSHICVYFWHFFTTICLYLNAHSDDLTLVLLSTGSRFILVLEKLMSSSPGWLGGPISPCALSLGLPGPRFFPPFWSKWLGNCSINVLYDIEAGLSGSFSSWDNGRAPSWMEYDVGTSARYVSVKEKKLHDSEVQVEWKKIKKLAKKANSVKINNLNMCLRHVSSCA